MNNLARALLFTLLAAAFSHVPSISASAQDCRTTQYADGKMTDCFSPLDERTSSSLFDQDGLLLRLRKWDGAGLLLSDQRYRNNQLNGMSTKYSPTDGRALERREFADGMPHGESVFWWPNGALKAIHNYESGTKTGSYRDFFQDGVLRQSGTIENWKTVGELHRHNADGSPQYSANHDPQGRLSGEERRYSSSGELQRVSLYRAGKLHGIQTHYGNSSIVTRKVCFQDGARQEGLNTCLGESGYEKVVEHFPDGQIMRSTEYVDGLRSGTEQIYYRDGTLRSEELFAAGQRNGVSVKYFSDGTPRVSANFDDDKLDGTRLLHFPSGEVDTKEEWADGILRKRGRRYKDGTVHLEEDWSDDLVRRTYFYPDGQTRREGDYSSYSLRYSSAFIPIGSHNFFFPDGERELEVNFGEDGWVDGKVIRYRPDGTIRTIEEWEKGRRVNFEVYEAAD
jgi:antitoxin component YwqK of YwqJK toxin-antitoxin module